MPGCPDPRPTLAGARGIHNGPVHRRLALVRRPSPRLGEGLVTHRERQPVDPERALHQWVAYVRALQAQGWAVVEAPRLDDCPDGVFVEDQVVVYGDAAVLTRSGAVQRRAELAGLAATMRSLGYRTERIVGPGTLDGGDVLKHDGLVWIGDAGPRGRTNDEGAAQLAGILAWQEVRTQRVPIIGVLHLKSALTALPDATVLGWPPAVADPGGFREFLPADEPTGAAVVLLGGTTVLMAASAPLTAQRLRRRGLEVVTVDIDELERLEGCVTCLSVRLRG